MAMRAYIVSGKEDKHGEIEVEPSLKEYYRLIGCDCIDIVVREIDGHPYNIVLDDEGLLKPNRITAMALTSDIFGNTERLAGTLLVFGVDEEWDLAGLDDDEVLQIQRHMVSAIFSDESIHPMLWYTR